MDCDSKKRIEVLEQTIRELEARNKTLKRSRDKHLKVNRHAGERAKELHCIYQVAQHVAGEKDTDAALEKIVRTIPLGWQHARIACARIIFKDKQFLSKEFVESPWKQSEKIRIGSRIVGSITLFYKKEMPNEFEGPFLAEERNLMRGIASIISFFIKKQQDGENKKLMEQQLLHSDRLATIGQLSAGVAHELNEPLGNILGFAQLSLKIPEVPGQVREDLKKIEESALHAREIIKKLMEFARQTPPRIEKIDFTKVIDNSVFFIESRCKKEGITVIKEYTPGVIITADPNQIKQVVTNLTINAIQAMAHGGKLSIGTRLEGERVILSVEDTGVGIAPQDLDKTFIPFFTTKDVGEGTGLGLSVVYGIIKNHKGDIKVSSEPGKGTTFEVSFPAEEA